MRPLSLSHILLSCLLSYQVVSAYTPVPRWGQAAVIINDALYIHGGKTDQFNAYSYSSAPTSNDLLYLPLSSPFASASPPWQVVSGSANSTSSLSPSLAWHTLSAFNTSQVLLFGGLPGVNSDIVLMGGSDSADLLDIMHRDSPNWIIEPASWANEPTRRIHHSACSFDGKIWIFGGERADGSNNPFSDHYVFNPSTLSFTQIPSTNGPSAISGHACAVLPNGQILVFGGVTEGSLNPFSRIWIFDTKKNSWSTVVISGVIPPPRRAFVVVLLGNGKILVHGGSDASFLETYSDGWILDTAHNPMVWSSVNALSHLGARRDHFGVARGSQVIFGLGYGSSGPASSDVQIFDSDSGQWVDQFTPPTTPSPTMTIPGPTHSPNTGSPTGGSGTISGNQPTSTVQSPDGPGNVPSRKPSSAAAIALGAALSTLVVVGSVVAVAIYVRKRNLPDSDFHMIGDEDHYRSNPYRARPLYGPIIANNVRIDGGHHHTVMGSLGFGAIARVVSGRSTYTAPERRDMLADEDTRDFGWGYDQRHHQASSGSVWSLQSVGAFLGGVKRSLWSREPSASSQNNSPWNEKTDPFADVPSYTVDDQPSTSANLLTPVPVPSRSYNVREQSFSSHSAHSYRDPFSDPVEEDWEQHDIGEMGMLREKNDPSDSLHLVRPHLPPPILTTLPPTTGFHTLSPLTERTSQGSLSLPSNSSHSHDRVVSPFEGTNQTSWTSHDYPSRVPSVGKRLGHTSIVDSLQPASNIRRSDTWWSRFSRTPFLDRKNSDSSRPSGIIDIRDPNPPPRLGAIEEKSVSNSTPSSSRESSQGAVPLLRQVSRMSGHRKSQSSIQTMRTADSEALERMGAVDVVQRIMSGSGRKRESTSSSFATETDSEMRALALVTNRSTDDSNSITGGPLVTPPEMTLDSPRQFTTSPRSVSPSPKTTPPAESASAPPPLSPRQKPPSGSAVAARVQEYERKMSQDQSSPPVSPRRKTGRMSVNYGLAPRPSLFVANPDHKAASSTDST